MSLLAMTLELSESRECGNCVWSRRTKSTLYCDHPQNAGRAPYEPLRLLPRPVRDGIYCDLHEFDLPKSIDEDNATIRALRNDLDRL